MSHVRQNLVYNLKRRRAALGISQMQLAARADISSGYVGELEMGRKYPAPEVLEKLAEALETEPFRLLMSEEDLADSGGSDAFYAAAELIGERLKAELEELKKRGGGA